MWWRVSVAFLDRFAPFLLDRGQRALSAIVPPSFDSAGPGGLPS